MSQEPNVKEAQRLLGWAQFNLGKGKTTAAQTLIDKALQALGADPFYPTTGDASSDSSSEG